MPDFLIDNGARWSASSGCTLETHERDASQSSPQYFGLIDCLCFLGVALAPEDRAMFLHVAFTLAAFRIIPFVVLLFSLAASAVPGTPRAVVRAWIFLAVVLFAYVGMLQGGAWTVTPAGFAAQVIAQKVVAIIMTAVVVWQSRVATTLNGPPARPAALPT